MRQTDVHISESVLEIPFVYKNEWIHLPVKVKQGESSYEGFFLFDTGAFTELFDSCGPLKILVPDAMEIPVKGALGRSSIKLRIAKDVDLTLGALGVRKSKILVTTRPGIFPVDCIGMLGADFFRNQIVEIDFENSCIRVIPSGLFNPSSPGLKIRMTGNYNPVLPDLSIAGMQPQDYLIDLGSKESIFIQRADESSLRRVLGDSVLTYSMDTGSSQGVDMSGSRIQSAYLLRYSRSFNGAPCREFEVAGIVNPGNAFRMANLGLGFARNVFSSVTLNMPAERLHYRLSGNGQSVARFNRDVYFRDEGGAFFTGPVLTTSSWYQNGLRPRQRVIRINNEDPQRYLDARKEGKEVSVSSITIYTAEGERTLSGNQ